MTPARSIRRPGGGRRDRAGARASGRRSGRQVPWSAGRVAVGLLLPSLALAFPAPPAAGQIAVRGDVVHVVSGDPILDGVVLVGANGRIEAVGPASTISLPPGIRVLHGAVVTPGLVDARTVVGLSGILGGTQDQEQLERSSPIQPQLRALDAYNPREPLVEWVRNLGTTTIHTGHGPGALVSGQTMVVKTTGTGAAEARVDTLASYAVTLGAEAVGAGGGWPGTRARAVAMLRSFLLRGRESVDREEASPAADGADLALNEARRILRREVPLLITAHRVPDILTALRLQEEFGFRLILDGAAEIHQVLEEVRRAGVPIILHPTMARHQGPLENASFESARLLHEAGVPFAIPSGFEPYFPKTRVLLMEAAMAAGYGLPFDVTLRAITLEPARILGVDHRVGSLERGKDADLVLFDGDPFEFVSRVCGVVIQGKVVSEACR
jgi:imidazolonepropionase-like amidohydrolase